MRTIIVASAAVLGVVLAAPAGFAQTTATPEQNLSMAQQEAGQHHPLRAIQALDRAEAALLESGASMEQRSPRDVASEEPESVRQIARAREALQNRQWAQADDYIMQAMGHPSVSGSDSGAGKPAVGSQPQKTE